MVGAKENGVISRGSPHDQVIEELIGRLIRNVLSDPHNFNTLTKLMALSDANNNPGKNRPHPRGQPIGNRPRDISNNEIIRPRDLPQITGLAVRVRQPIVHRSQTRLGAVTDQEKNESSFQTGRIQ